MRIVIVGGGAGGIGAAGAARQQNPETEVVLFTEYEDVGYSPCGIPFVHGREIASFDHLFLQTKEFYAERGFDMRYEQRIEAIEPDRQRVHVAGQDALHYDALVLATGFNYEVPQVPGNDLQGLYYVKNIRRAKEWDEVIERARCAVILEAGPIGVEMASQLAHRDLEVHLVDPRPWLMAEVADPDVMERVEHSLGELGAQVHLRSEVTELVGDNGHVRAVATSTGELPADLVIIGTAKRPNNELAEAAGLAIGSTGGLIVDEHMATSAPGVYAAGDCAEVPHSVANLPVTGLSGSHAYAQGKVAGANAAKGDRRYKAVEVPWGMMAGKWMIGGVSLGETLAEALDIPYVLGKAEGITRARYYPGTHKLLVKLLADPKTEQLIGAQMVGGEGVKERADFLAMCVRLGVTVEELAWMENVYSPPIGALGEPIAAAATNVLANR